VELAERGDVTGVCPRVARPTTRWTERQAGSALEAIKAYERNVKVRPYMQVQVPLEVQLLLGC
jgi:hypothetical protein